MAVYVDPVVGWGKSKTWRYPSNCHMFADTLEELHTMAERIGLKRAWFQDKSLPHYDLTKSKRQQAVSAGAIELGFQETANKWIELGFFPRRQAERLEGSGC